MVCFFASISCLAYPRAAKPPVIAPIDAAVTTASPTPSQILPTVLSTSTIAISFSEERFYGVLSSGKKSTKTLHFLVKFALNLSCIS
jgi:hypothetical protein